MILLLLALLQGPVLTVTVPPATPFTISFDHPGDNSVAFRWWCENAIVKNFPAVEVTKATTANADGTFTFTATVPGLPAGQHVCFVSATYPGDTTEYKGDAVTFPVASTTPPTTGPKVAPIRLMIVVPVKGGV